MNFERAQARRFLATSLLVPPAKISDEQVDAWLLLSAEIRSYEPAPRSRGVEIKDGVHPDAPKFFGPRSNLRGEQ